jgi:transcriptional regulator of arginine metabolism
MDSKTELRSDAEVRLEVLQQLLREGNASTQDELCKALRQKKFHVTQSTISRDLRRLGAMKTLNSDGETVYALAGANVTLPPPVSHSLGHLILDIQSNESMIVLHTSPGSASLVARHLDSMRSYLGTLGTIAGDDTIFIAPASTKQISSLIKKIKEEF